MTVAGRRGGAKAVQELVGKSVPGPAAMVAKTASRLAPVGENWKRVMLTGSPEESLTTKRTMALLEIFRRAPSSSTATSADDRGIVAKQKGIGAPPRAPVLVASRAATRITRSVCSVDRPKNVAASHRRASVLAAGAAHRACRSSQKWAPGPRRDRVGQRIAPSRTRHRRP